MAGFALAFRLIAPDPDGSLATTGDRQQLAYSYAGTLAPAAAPVDVILRAQFATSPRPSPSGRSPSMANVIPEVYPLNDLALSVKLEEISPTTGVKSAVTTGTVAAFLATSSGPSATAADPAWLRR